MILSAILSLLLISAPVQAGAGGGVASDDPLSAEAPSDQQLGLVRPLTQDDWAKVRGLEFFKAGWECVPFPIVGYHSDLGFQLGAFANIIDYGKQPSYYPEYRQRIHVEGSWYTKGRTVLHLDYTAAHIIPGVHLFTALTYQTSPLSPFYGFNGFSAYDKSMDRNNGYAYYCIQHNSFRALASFRGTIKGKLKWVGGATFWSHRISDISDRFKYDTEQTLFREYVDKGIIHSDEKNGSLMELNAGLLYDSRDFDLSPTKGVYADIWAIGACGLDGKTSPYLKLCAHYRQYLSPWGRLLTFAWHLAYQGTVAGSAPFYMQNNLYTQSILQVNTTGLGGMNSIRGILSGRLVGDSYAWANIEARFRVYEYSDGIHSFGVGVNPFYDAGAITRPYRLDEFAAASGRSVEDLGKEARAIHQSAGLGLKLSIEKNTIVSFEAAKPFSNKDGNVAFYFTANYIF